MSGHHPSSLSVRFPASNCPPSGGGDRFYIVDASGGNCPGEGAGARQVFDSARAYYDGGDGPSNAAELSALARAIAEHTYKWRCFDLDISYSGIINPDPSAAYDDVVLEYDERHAATRLVSRPGWREPEEYGHHATGGNCDPAPCVEMIAPEWTPASGGTTRYRKIKICLEEGRLRKYDLGAASLPCVCPDGPPPGDITFCADFYSCRPKEVPAFGNPPPLHPRAGVSIRLVGLDPGNVFEAGPSDDSGRVCVGPLPPDVYTITPFTADGYEEDPFTIDMTSPGSYAWTWEIKDLVCVRFLSACRLGEAGESMPVQGVTLDIIGPPPAGSATSGPDGWACVRLTANPPFGAPARVTLASGASHETSFKRCSSVYIVVDYICVRIHGCRPAPPVFGMPPQPAYLSCLDRVEGADVILEADGNPQIIGQTDACGEICGYPTVYIPVPILPPPPGMPSFTLTVSKDRFKTLVTNDWYPCGIRPWTPPTPGLAPDGYLPGKKPHVLEPEDDFVCACCSVPAKKTLVLSDSTGPHNLASGFGSLVGLPVWGGCWDRENLWPSFQCFGANTTTPVRADVHCYTRWDGVPMYRLSVGALVSWEDGTFPNSNKLGCRKCNNLTFLPDFYQWVGWSSPWVASECSPLALIFSLPDRFPVGAGSVPNPVGPIAVLTE